MSRTNINVTARRRLGVIIVNIYVGGERRATLTFEQCKADGRVVIDPDTLADELRPYLELGREAAEVVARMTA